MENSISFIWPWKKSKKKEKKKKEDNITVEQEIHKPIETITSTRPTEPKGLIKRLRFPVVGLNYENRREILTKIIEKYKQEDKFDFEPYEGLTNKEILEEYFSEKIYEISEGNGLKNCEIEPEDDNEFDSNALKVLVKDLKGESHHIGYVPKEYCKEIRKLMDKYRILVASSVTGGKYKSVDYSEYGDEKVRIKDSSYGLNLSLSFWDNYNEKDN